MYIVGSRQSASHSVARPLTCIWPAASLVKIRISQHSCLHIAKQSAENCDSWRKEELIPLYYSCDYSHRDHSVKYDDDEDSSSVCDLSPPLHQSFK